MAADHENECPHDFQVAEVVVTARGADQVSTCSRCGAVGFEASQAAVRDTRPAL